VTSDDDADDADDDDDGVATVNLQSARSVFKKLRSLPLQSQCWIDGSLIHYLIL